MIWWACSPHRTSRQQHAHQITTAVTTAATTALAAAAAVAVAPVSHRWADLAAYALSRLAILAFFATQVAVLGRRQSVYMHLHHL